MIRPDLEITDTELKDMRIGWMPCGNCDACLDGLNCSQNGSQTTLREAKLLVLIGKLEAENEKFKGAIANHRDQRGDDRCYLDDAELYAVLGEAQAVTALPPREEFLANCARFHAS